MDISSLGFRKHAKLKKGMGRLARLSIFFFPFFFILLPRFFIFANMVHIKFKFAFIYTPIPLLCGAFLFLGDAEEIAEEIYYRLVEERSNRSNTIWNTVKLNGRNLMCLMTRSCLQTRTNNRCYLYSRLHYVGRYLLQWFRISSHISLLSSALGMWIWIFLYFRIDLGCMQYWKVKKCGKILVKRKFWLRWV